MVPKEEALDDENSLSSAHTSESSDSYTYLLHDFESPRNRITEEWEAIERTLYQDCGKHVTDPILLKECKLWRETFPHIRVTGTAIKRDEESDNVGEIKDIEVRDKNKLTLSKIQEKREKIKKTVVSQIVERLINKLNSNTGGWENRLGITNKFMELNGQSDKNNIKSFGLKQEKESYFERGKGLEPKNGRIVTCGVGRKKNKDSLSDLFDNFEYDFSFEPIKTRNSTSTRSLWSGSNDSYQQAKDFSNALARNEEIRSGNSKFNIAEKNLSTSAKKKKTSDSLSNIVKPFEATKKIDKKYEAILDRILENKGINDKKKSPQSKGCVVDSLEKKRELNSSRRTKQLPTINNFSNNWLSRAEQNSSDLYSYKDLKGRNFSYENYENGCKNMEKQLKSQSCRKTSNAYDLDEKFFEELKHEMGECSISNRKDYGDEINLKRPQLHNRFNQSITAKTSKSLSCSNLPKNQKPKTNKVLKNNVEKGKSELNVKSGVKKTGKNTGNQNMQLPPIETSIICTEIITRPKEVMRIYPKKYL